MVKYHLAIYNKKCGCYDWNIQNTSDETHLECDVGPYSFRQCGQHRVEAAQQPQTSKSLKVTAVASQRKRLHQVHHDGWWLSTLLLMTTLPTTHRFITSFTLVCNTHLITIIQHKRKRCHLREIQTTAEKAIFSEDVEISQLPKKVLVASITRLIKCNMILKIWQAYKNP